MKKFFGAIGGCLSLAGMLLKSIYDAMRGKPDRVE